MRPRASSGVDVEGRRSTLTIWASTNARRSR